MDTRIALAGSVLLGLVVACSRPPSVEHAQWSAPQAISYGRDVRPILSDRCFACHGPDEEQRKAGLRLDLAESATEDLGGYAAIVPGKPEQSELYRRIAHAEGAERMPPADSPKAALSAQEQETLRRWIEAGAVYEPHWSFVPPVRPTLPPGSATHPIDRFVDASLAEQGLRANPPATERTLLRRLFLDLTGLPPTPEEIDQYLADPRSERYERWIERLMSTEPYRSRYAERMAVPWLDAARYADTCGIHMDAGRSIWPWRDWVLAAYREGMPFDRFVTDQLAGDLVPNASLAQRVASGFHRNHVTTDEGGAIAEEYLVEYAVDRVATTGSVLLGLTVGCARCHDHKYDPIRQKDFYGLMAFFNSIEEPGLYDQRPDPKRAFEPFLEVPTQEQVQTRSGLQEQIAQAKRRLDAPPAEETQAYERFLAKLIQESALRYETLEFVGAQAQSGAQFTLQPDRSIFVSGPNPDTDRHTLEWTTQGMQLRVLALEALSDPRLLDGRVGRFEVNGNAVLTDFVVEASSLVDPNQSKRLRFAWCWADAEQANGDFRITNALDQDPASGWAVDGHNRKDSRVALFLSDEPFGWEGGTRLKVELGYQSIHRRHTFGRVRLSAAQVDPQALERWPTHSSVWFAMGPFAGGSEALYSQNFGPESSTGLDRQQEFRSQRWRAEPEFRNGRTQALPDGVNVHFVAHELWVPSQRSIDVGLGSDDGVEVFLDGKSVFRREVARAVELDSDRVRLELSPGRHWVLLKIFNTGGRAGFAWNPKPAEPELASEHLLALVPPGVEESERRARGFGAWRLRFSEEYRSEQGALSSLEQQLKDLEARIPRTMVMKELATPRSTHLLMRGQYDKPDTSQTLARAIPPALGQLPKDAPPDRRGLAQWLFSADNPLVARVAVNRLWEQIFGNGIVRTSEDFGLQGEWPTHPELLDWLAVEFRESGWDQRHMLRLILTSAAYRRSARVDPSLAERDPENRYLARYPRRRLSAEEIRDQALYIAGLLVEKSGGPSVKPYQPEGLWEEVAMLQSNTRVYERGAGEDLWRRSLYTYWKRAAPPPSMLTFDAPTREFCTIRRTVTNTPLQSLVLWNDEQFREAARELAERSLLESGSSEQRLARMFERACGREPLASESHALLASLQQYRERYSAEPSAAQALLAVGISAVDPTLQVAELAAWTMVATALLNLDATLCRS